jgi:hypothetical protein
MNPPSSAWKVARAFSSIAVDNAGSATVVASRWMMSVAVFPASDSRSGIASLPASGSSSTSPPADMTRALIHTM